MSATPHAIGGDAFLLEPTTYICFRDDSAVILDLQRACYLSLDIADTAGLEEWIEGWPILPRGEARRTGQQIRDVVTSMEERGLLTRRRERGKPFSPAILGTPTRVIGNFGMPPARLIRARHVLIFAVAFLRAQVALKCSRLPDLLRMLALKRSMRGDSESSTNVEEVRALVMAFNVIMPLFFGSNDRCLLRSLVLAQFLYKFHFYPRLVLGVQTSPFAAHCWLQDGSTVVNDSLERVHTFTPIFTT